MRTGDFYRGLIAVPCPPSYAVQRRRSRSNSLSVPVRGSHTHVDRPPGVDERGDPRHHLASLPSCVVKPAQAHWFFNSSKLFSESPRSRQCCAVVRSSSLSEVTSTAYSSSTPLYVTSGRSKFNCWAAFRLFFFSSATPSRNGLSQSSGLSPTASLNDRLYSLGCAWRPVRPRR